jgi:nucleotide-binding universal stress UspA family protein
MSGAVLMAVDTRAPDAARDVLSLGCALADGCWTALHAVTVCEDAEEVGERAAVLASWLDPGHEGAALSVLVGHAPARELHELCDRTHPCALVIGMRPAGIGPVARDVLRGGGVPVAVAPAGYAASPRPLAPIAVAYDGTAGSGHALELGADLAERLGATAEVLHVPDTADPVLALARASADLGLLVAGSRPFGPLRAVLLGDVTRQLLPLARCPVIIVPRLPSRAEAVALPGGMEAPAE